MPGTFRIFGILIEDEVVTMWGIIAVIAVLSLIIRRNLKERPGKLQNMAEFALTYVENLMSDIMGRKKTAQYFTFVATLFIYIIASNYVGLLPGAGMIPGFKAPTSSLSVTLGFSLCVFMALQYFSLKLGFRHFIRRFIKPIFMLPLLLLDELIKPMSLSLRLYGNVFGEESVMEQLYEICPVGAPLIMMVLSLLFCYIQAQVFTLLTSIYLDEATEIED